MEYTYDQMFQRNIGVFTQEEQDKIKSLKIVIIGVGGLGAPTAENLARLGVGELRLVEPDVFEVSNLNRQTGANVDTLGQNKAQAMSELIQKINPKIKVSVISKKIHNEELRKIISDCDIIVDGIDFFNINDTLELHNIAKTEKIPIVSAQGCISMITFSFFSPGGLYMSDLIQNGDINNMIGQVIGLTFPVLPRELNQKMLNDFLSNINNNSNNIHIPSYCVLVPLSGAITTQMIINILIKKQNSEYIPKMPNLLYIDNNLIEIKRYIK